MFAKLLTKYQNVFAKASLDLGKTNLVEHAIDTGNHPPIKETQNTYSL